MTTTPSRLEAAAYREASSDGIIDTFAGLALLWMGVAWMWIDALAGVAGALPAVAIAPMLAIRRRVMEPRTGYVRFRADRRRRERTTVVSLLALGVGMLAAAVLVFVFATEGGGANIVGRLIPGLPAFLLAIPALLAGVALGIRRVLAYAVALVTAGLVTAELDANPGVAFLAAGALIGVVGVTLVVRYLRRHPVVEEP